MGGGAGQTEHRPIARGLAGAVPGMSITGYGDPASPHARLLFLIVLAGTTIEVLT